ncbi:MAG: DUF6941 family protein [Actinomycetes bacterium]
MDIDALLADHAQVSGKLFVSGAGIDVISVPPDAPPPFPVTLAVAGVVRVPWTETNREHRLQFLVLDEDGRAPVLADPTGADPMGAEPDRVGGEMAFNVGRPPGLPDGDEQMVPFAFQFQGLPLGRLGKYIVQLSLDDRVVRALPFRVMQPR